LLVFFPPGFVAARSGLACVLLYARFAPHSRFAPDGKNPAQYFLALGFFPPGFLFTGRAKKIPQFCHP
jgi:hypothetical protein